MVSWRLAAAVCVVLLVGCSSGREADRGESGDVAQTIADEGQETVRRPNRWTFERFPSDRTISQGARSIPDTIKGIPICRAEDLRAWFFHAESGGTQTIVEWFAIANKGSTRCSLRGRPKVTILDSLGRRLHEEGGARFPDQGPTLVVLEPDPDSTKVHVGMTWDGCDGARAVQMDVGLPQKAGTIRIENPSEFNSYGGSMCDGRPDDFGLRVGVNFINGPVGDPYRHWGTKLYVSVPREAALYEGTHSFSMKIFNGSSRAIEPATCPLFSYSVGGGPIRYRQMNCEAVGTIQPKEIVELKVNGKGPLGANALLDLWSLYRWGSPLDMDGKVGL